LEKHFHLIILQTLFLKDKYSLSNFERRLPERSYKLCERSLLAGYTAKNLVEIPLINLKLLNKCLH